tara:strand:+ start:1645 stop:1935 length:291 start_codon:yes stop_codon:yes gene_type:complete
MSNPYSNPRNLAKAQAKANKYSKKITLKPSTRKNKKLDAFVNKKKVASFGDSRYTDFILSGDKKKRAAYRKRHAKDLLVNPKNKFTAGKLAYFILW